MFEEGVPGCKVHVSAFLCIEEDGNKKRACVRSPMDG